MTPRQSPRCTIITFLTAPSAHCSHQATRTPDAISRETFNPHRPRLSSRHVYRTCRLPPMRQSYAMRGTSDKLLNLFADSTRASRTHTFSRNRAWPEDAGQHACRRARSNQRIATLGFSWRWTTYSLWNSIRPFRARCGGVNLTSRLLEYDHRTSRAAHAMGSGSSSNQVYVLCCIGRDGGPTDGDGGPMPFDSNT